MYNMNLDYEKAMTYIEDTRKYGSVLGLESIERLLEGLGNPQNELKVIHVAGTNGKGSTTSYLAHILASAGYLVGRFNSPAVFEYREIIQLLYQSKDKDSEYENYEYKQTEDIDSEYDNHVYKYSKDTNSEDTNSEDTNLKDKHSEHKNQSILCESIPKFDFISLLDQIKQVCNQMVEHGFSHPTTFEIETALSFLYMKEKQVDFAIIEVGLGGRLDASNIIRKPICAVITSIDMDHMEFLGHSLEAIAREKAGIIKENSNVAVIEQEEAVMTVIKETCQKMNADLSIAYRDSAEDVVHRVEGIQFVFNNGMTRDPYLLPLLGTHQLGNGLLALEVVEVLRKMGYSLKIEAVQQGLTATKWPGRFELLSRQPNILIDGAHNQHAVLQLISSLKEYFPNRKYIFIMGVLRDKDYVGMLQLIGPYAKKIITVTPQNIRALESKALYECVLSLGLEGIEATSIEQGLQIALEEAKEEDTIVGFGSLSYLGMLRNEVQALCTVK